MKDRRNSGMEKRVGCPFYLSASMKDKILRCEGYMEGMKIEQKFKSQKDLEDHVVVNCEGQCYQHCPLYRAIKDMRWKFRG